MRAENDLSFFMHKLITHAQFIHASITYLWHAEYGCAVGVIFLFFFPGQEEMHFAPVLKPELKPIAIIYIFK